MSPDGRPEQRHPVARGLRTGLEGPDFTGAGGTGRLERKAATPGVASNTARPRLFFIDKEPGSLDAVAITAIASVQAVVLVIINTATSPCLLDWIG